MAGAKPRTGAPDDELADLTVNGLPTPRPGLRRAKKITAAYVKRREAILNAAGEIFYEKSYHAASMEDVAERAGMLKPALYYYFASKEDLLFELAAGDQSVAMIQQFYDTDEAVEPHDGVSRLRAFVDRWVQFTEARNPGFIAVEREYRQLSGDRLDNVVALRRRLPSLLESILDQGTKDGSFDPDINVSVAAKNIAAVLNDLYVWYRPRGTSTIRDLNNWHTTFILRGLGATTR